MRATGTGRRVTLNISMIEIIKPLRIFKDDLNVVAQILMRSGHSFITKTETYDSFIARMNLIKRESDFFHIEINIS